MVEILKSKRVLVTGASGQVGRALVLVLSDQCELVTAARGGADVNLDLTNSEQVVATIESVRPDIIINAAAYTQVDKAEDEPNVAHIINADAPGIIAQQCKKNEIMLIHYSTDYVFSGVGDKPLTEEEPVSPINVYGKTKLAGERAIQAVNCDHLIFRTCWVYDEQGKNFPNTILNAARKNTDLKVVNDQYGTPTSAEFIASTTAQIICSKLASKYDQSFNGIYNLTAAGHTSWYKFAEHIVEQASKYEKLLTDNIAPVATDHFPSRAKRPNWSVLSNKKISCDFGVSQVSWEQLFDKFLKRKYSIYRY